MYTLIAISSRGKTITAPEPSPNASFASITGFNSRCVRIFFKAGSFPACDAIIYFFVPGDIYSAVSAAIPDISPSMTTGIPYSAPPINTPASPAISNPPIHDKSLSASSLYPLYISHAFLTVSVLFLSPSFVSPAP